MVAGFASLVFEFCCFVVMSYIQVLGTISHHSRMAMVTDPRSPSQAGNNITEMEEGVRGFSMFHRVLESMEVFLGNSLESKTRKGT